MEATQPDSRMTPQRVRLARTLALVADFLQVMAFPLFAPGGLSILNGALDIGVAAAMTWLLGWRWAFLPTFATELVPVLDLFPTWSAAVFLVTAGRAPDSPAKPPASPPGS